MSIRCRTRWTAGRASAAEVGQQPLYLGGKVVEFGVGPADELTGKQAIVGIADARVGRTASGGGSHQRHPGVVVRRRRKPSDDLMTNLVQAEIDGARLTDDDIGDFLVLISVAGNDTTKQTTTRVALALHEHPEQRDWLMADFDGRIVQAAEEFVRYASPVMQFTRTAAADTELNGIPIASGDKVALFYCSGNRDNSVFVDPEKFDLSRPRTPHVGFGGGGPHFCLGNGVAKTQLRALFRQLLTRVPHIEFGEPQPLMSNFINGIVRLPAYIR